MWSFYVFNGYTEPAIGCVCVSMYTFISITVSVTAVAEV